MQKDLRDRIRHEALFNGFIFQSLSGKQMNISDAASASIYMGVKLVEKKIMRPGLISTKELFDRIMEVNKSENERKVIAYSKDIMLMLMEKQQLYI